jgi:hypothetical protein
MSNLIHTPSHASHICLNCTGPTKTAIKSGSWDSISLYDENGSFRGEAKFSTKKEAYLKSYKDRINKYLNAAGKAKTRLKLQVFEFDNTSMTEERENMAIITI